MSCGMDIAKDEIERFASVLCYGKRIFPEVLETLYMFASQAKMNAGEKVDVENKKIYTKNAILILENS